MDNWFKGCVADDERAQEQDGGHSRYYLRWGGLGLLDVSDEQQQIIIHIFHFQP